MLNKLDRIEEWARTGLSDSQIATNLGIHRSTFEKYKATNEDIRESLRKGKEVVNIEVVNALYKKATGYKVKEKVPVKLKDTYYDEKGNKCINERVEVVETEKEIQPDTVAIKFWLMNKDKENWKDNPSKYELDKELLELRKKQAEQGEW